MRFLMLLFVVGIAVVPTCAQTPPPVDPKIVLKVSIATDQRELRIGETIPLQLAFSSNDKDPYQVNMAQYDRCGPMNYEHSDVELRAFLSSHELPVAGEKRFIEGAPS